MSREFPGEEPQVAAVRRCVAEALGRAHPACDDAILLASELATNALKHTKSGTPGGIFRVTIGVYGHAVRIEVADQGGSSVPRLLPPSPIATAGRGLALVAALADAWGVDEDEPGRRVWFTWEKDESASAQA